MSIRFQCCKKSRLLLVLGLLAMSPGLSSKAFGQQMKVRITLLPASSRAAIEVTCSPRSQWSFLNSYASVLGLGNRIEKFSVIDDAGKDVVTHKLAPGQFESAQEASHIKYEVNLLPPAFPSDSAFVSWLAKERGVLMLGDVLPLSARSSVDSAAEVQFDLPVNWQVSSTEASLVHDQFQVSDVDQAVFAVGSRLRVSEANESGMMFRLTADGDWAFSDLEVIEMASKVLRAYKKTFGAMPAKRTQLILFPFPQSASASLWGAETKGSTVTLLSGRVPSKVGALAQLSTPVTHELFHWWVPNDLALDPDYDWFYEGFTVYQASRTAVDLGTLTFPEFLNSIARAYDASVRDDATSLLVASKTRFTTGRTTVYAKAQVIALLYDLRLRSASRRKRSLTDVYRRLFEAYSSERSAGKGSSGNQAVTSVLGAELGSPDFVSRFISNPVSIQLATELSAFGLKVETQGLRTYISVNEKLTRQQRDLLRNLGYNDDSRAVKRR